MSKIDRRKFIKLSAGADLATVAMSPLIQQVLAVKAHNASRSIKDVEHIVILTFPHPTGKWPARFPSIGWSQNYTTLSCGQKQIECGSDQRYSLRFC